MSSDVESISDNEVAHHSDGEILSDNPIEPENVENQPNENEVTQTEENKDGSGDESKKKPVEPKKRVLRPQPKFNEQTIKTAKGLPAIKHHFQDIKLKGKGCEEHDLNVILKTYEYWSHRFFPKYTFDDSIARLEVLGAKKTTVNYLKRIRLGLDDDIEEKLVLSDNETPTTGFVEPEPFEDQFDQLMSSTTQETEANLTVDQQERINQNRLRAEAIRKERLSKMGQLNESADQTNSDLSQDQRIAELEVADDQDMDIENMLNMINEGEESAVNSTATDLQNKKDEIVSDSIRTERLTSLLSRDSNEDEELTFSSTATDLQQKKDELVSNSIRKETFRALLNKDSDDEDNLIIEGEETIAQNLKEYIQNNKSDNSMES